MSPLQYWSLVGFMVGLSMAIATLILAERSNQARVQGNVRQLCDFMENLSGEVCPLIIPKAGEQSK